MVTVYRSGGLRLVIFFNDHPPAHVHVFGDGHAKINLAGIGGQPELVWTENMKAGETRRALAVVLDQQQYLLGKWGELHG